VIASELIEACSFTHHRQTINQTSQAQPSKHHQQHNQKCINQQHNTTSSAATPASASASAQNQHTIKPISITATATKDACCSWSRCAAAALGRCVDVPLLVAACCCSWSLATAAAAALGRLQWLLLRSLCLFFGDKDASELRVSYYSGLRVRLRVS
jgi:hypothetical protein